MTLVDRCAEQQGPMVELLRRMVEQGSYSRDVQGGTAMARLLREELGGIDGLHVELRDSRDHAPHVLCCSSAARDDAAGCVALVGHHDTVFPPGTFEGFRVDGDIARGPGVLDMKGGLTICCFALRLLSSEGLLERLPIRFAIVSDEEIGSPEGGAVIEQHLRGAASALVFEAGRAGDAIITSRKGTGGICAVARGKAAHSGNHHAEGANAIWALAKLIDGVQRLTDYEAGITLNVGTVEGGTTRNTVPDQASALIDLRFLSVAGGEATVARIEEIARQAAAAVPGTTIALEGGVARPPLERTDGNVALMQEYAACAAAAGLGHGEAPLIGGGSDASTTAAIGIPSIDGLGPRGSGFHTPEELIEIPSLAMRLEALVRFLLGRMPS